MSYIEENKLEELVEKSIILTFAKISEKKIEEYNPDSQRDIIGIFINYFYKLSGKHSELDTRDFNAEKEKGIITIRGNPRKWTCSKLSERLSGVLNRLSHSQFYQFWLRSRFEDHLNKNAPIQIQSVKEFIKNFKNGK